MKSPLLKTLCSLACVTFLTGCATGPAALIPPLAASALKNLPPFDNSPQALAAVTGNSGNSGTTIIKGKTATIIIHNGKTVVIPKKQPAQ